MKQIRIYIDAENASVSMLVRAALRECYLWQGEAGPPDDTERSRAERLGAAASRQAITSPSIPSSRPSSSSCEA